MQNTTYLNVFLKNKEDIENTAQDVATLIQSAIFKSSHPKNQSFKTDTNNQTQLINNINLIFEKRYVLVLGGKNSIIQIIILNY